MHSPSHHVETLSRSRSVAWQAHIQAFVCAWCVCCGGRVQCGVCAFVRGVSCCVCWCVYVGVYVGVCWCVCAESVCLMCVLCCGVLCCVIMCGVGAGVGVQCVVCVVCCVWRGFARGKPTVCRFKTSPVCRFKTPPCVPAKRAHVFNMSAFCRYTRRRFEPTHGDVLSIHTGSLSLLSFSLSLFFLSSFVLFLCSPLFSLLSALCSLLFSFSNNWQMITRSVGTLCAHTALTCLSVRVPVLWLIPCLANMFASCKKQLSWFYCASLVPLGMKWACICAGNECCVWVVCWWCLVVSMWPYVLVCPVFVVLLDAWVLASMSWLLSGGDGSIREKDVCNFQKNPAREFTSITVLIDSKIC